MISIIIPVYNEEKRIKDSVDTIFNFLDKRKEKYEVIVVNDGSVDSTKSMLIDLQKKYLLRIIDHPCNMGKGAAIKTGVKNSQGEIILFTDIDLSVPIEFLGTYLERLDKNTDIVIGTRAAKESMVEIRQSFLRESLGELFTYLANFILDVGVSDFTCGFKMFRKQAADVIFSKQRVKRWAFDAESLFIARIHHFTIKEVPVVWRHKEESKVRFPKDLVETLIDLLIIRWNGILGRYS